MASLLLLYGHGVKWLHFRKTEVEQDKIAFAFPAFLDHQDAGVGDGVVSASLEPGLQDEAAPNQVWPEEDERDAMRAEKPALHGAFPQRKSVPPRVAVPLRRGISAVW